MKSHITKQHVKKNVPKSVEGVAETAETDAAALADLEQWDRPRDDEVEELEEEVVIGGGDSQEMNVIVINDVTGQEGNLVQAVERIKCLEEDLAAKEEVVKKLETELETANDLGSIANAKVASMEVENENLKAQVSKYLRISLNQRDDMNKMKAGGPDPEMERKLKLAHDEVKSKAKTVEALEKTKKELAKKVEEEVSARAKAEADCAKFSKMVDILQDKNVSDKSTTKSKVVCRDLNKPGGCPRAGKCTFHHPALARENKSIDCHHWMNGRCKYQEQSCKFKHDSEKKAVNASKRKRSEDEPAKSVSQTNNVGQQDFLLGLVRALSQGSTGEAGLGAAAEPARGLEIQRNIRPRMASPKGAARGMEEQQRSNRSYANAASSQNREHNSPRGLEDQGGVQEMVERMRGMVRPPQSPTPVDSMQEGLQLLMQIARQSGMM